MLKVLAYVGATWLIVIAVILLMTAVSPGMNEIAQQAAVDIAASGNMSQIVGIEDAVKSYPVWKWGLPVLLGVGVTGYIFYKNREELKRR